jgi:hypothetical protein
MGLAKPRKSRRALSTGLGLAHATAVSRGFGWVYNRTNLFLLSKPGLLAGYPDPLLTLRTVHRDGM